MHGSVRVAWSLGFVTPVKVAWIPGSWHSCHACSSLASGGHAAVPKVLTLSGGAIFIIWCLFMSRVLFSSFRGLCRRALGSNSLRRGYVYHLVPEAHPFGMPTGPKAFLDCRTCLDNDPAPGTILKKALCRIRLVGGTYDKYQQKDAIDNCRNSSHSIHSSRQLAWCPNKVHCHFNQVRMLFHVISFFSNYYWFLGISTFCWWFGWYALGWYFYVGGNKVFRFICWTMSFRCLLKNICNIFTSKNTTKIFTCIIYGCIKRS